MRLGPGGGWGSGVVVDEGLGAQLLARAEQDQALRVAVASALTDQERAAAARGLRLVDEANTAWLEEVVAAGGWPGWHRVGTEAAHAAWLLAQHATDRGFQRRCLALLEEEVAAEDAAAVDLAYLTDRVLVRDGRAQRLGTQFVVDEGERFLLAVDDEQRVASRRRRVGLAPVDEDVARLPAGWVPAGERPGGAATPGRPRRALARSETRALATAGAVAATREAFVDALVAAGAITDGDIERAFCRVPRHALVAGFWYHDGGGQWVWADHDPARPDGAQVAVVYSDRALVTGFHDNGMPASSTSRPSLVAAMLARLDLAVGMRVLEIGAGTGYHAALLAELVGEAGEVVAVDVDADVVACTRRRLSQAGYDQVRLMCGDGVHGAEEHAPFDRVVATVGCQDLPPSWAGQLAPGGFLLVPLEHAGVHPLVCLHPDGSALRGQVVGWTGFMPAVGAMATVSPWRRGWVIAGSHTAEGVHERPAWPGYGQGAPVTADGATAAECGFHLYLAGRSPRASWGPYGPGVSAGPRGWAAVSGGVVRWAGDPALSGELEALHHEWARLDQPTTADYELVLQPRGGASEPGACTIDRQWHTETLRVNDGPARSRDHPRGARR